MLFLHACLNWSIRASLMLRLSHTVNTHTHTHTTMWTLSAPLASQDNLLNFLFKSQKVSGLLVVKSCRVLSNEATAAEGPFV